MGIKNIIAISIFIICIITISLLASGGCDLDFGGGSDGDGGDGGNLESMVQGTIISQPNNGLTARLSNNGDLPEFFDLTDSNGNFFIQGNFNGCLTLRLEFQDGSENVLAFTNVTVFPKTNLDLGDVSLDNGNVILEGPDDISVNFDGNLNFTPPALETCEGGVGDSEGTIVVTKGNTDITVQITPTTTEIINADNIEIGCNNLFGNEEVEVTGTLQVHDTVLATLIRLK